MTPHSFILVLHLLSDRSTPRREVKVVLSVVVLAADTVIIVAVVVAMAASYIASLRPELIAVMSSR